MGNLWIIRPSDQIFNDLEIEFVQQLAAQCAIAIRQARLYQKSQSQINELWNNQHIFHKVFQIIYQASQQQKQLVDDLLSLCYLDAKKEIVDVKSINIQQLINLIVKPFEQSTQKQRQKLMVNMCVDLGVFRSDQNIIKRILTELLNNACKYTPTQQTITLSISHKLDSNAFQFTVANSGVEISAEEQDKIFDKLYRIPNNDPWSHGGTGLGLTLVKKLVQVLQGEIIVISENQLTQFIVTIPNQK